MTQLTKERIDAFLKDLFELSMKHHIEIYGCGCCGSPSLIDMPESNASGKILYTQYVTIGEENLELVYGLVK